MKTIRFDNRNKIIISLIGLFLFFIFLHFNSVNAPLIRDEGEYAYSAQLLLKGGIPYKDAFIQKPPLIIYSYALSQILHLGIFWGPRILSYFFIILATIILGYVVKKDFGTKTGLLAMWLFTIMMFQAGFEQFTANVEMFLILPLIGLVALYQTKKERYTGLFVGLLAVIAIFYKPTASLPILFLLVVWFWERRNYRWLAQVIFGGLLGVFLSLAYFLKQGGLIDLFNATFVYNKQYVLAGAGGLFGFWQYFSAMLLHWWPVFVLIVVYLIIRPKRWWFYFGLYITAVIGTGGGLYSHYYIPATLFLAAITAIAIANAAFLLAGNLKISQDRLFMAIAVFVVIVISWSAKNWIFLSPAEFSARKFIGTPFNESLAVAEQLKTLTSADDRILIAGSEPQILYYANRLSSTKYITFYPLFINTPLAEGFQKEAIMEIEKYSPKIIIISMDNSSWLQNDGSPRIMTEYLDKTLSSEYKIIPNSEFEKSGLLIFKKNN